MYTLVGKFQKDINRKSDGKLVTILQLHFIFDGPDQFGNSPSDGQFVISYPCTEDIYKSISVGQSFNIIGTLPGSNVISFVN